jgi:hypothetical protein
VEALEHALDPLLALGHRRGWREVIICVSDDDLLVIVIIVVVPVTGGGGGGLGDEQPATDQS